MDDRIRALLTAKPLPLLIRMGTPNTLAFFVQASVSMTEVWFIGQLGSVSLAAI
jgi:Na+-driven multidrug efflux pump